MTDVVPDAHSGCYLAIPIHSVGSESLRKYPEWCLGFDSFRSGGSDVPDITIDPDEGVLSVINATNSPKTYYITVENCDRIIVNGGCDILSENKSRSGRDYVTFVVLAYPDTRVDLCRLEPNSRRRKKRLSYSALASVRISSDMQEYIERSPSGHWIALQVFPLVGSTFLCTQSSGGALTHFAHPSTYHAVDFRCPMGTPVVAIADSVVVDIRNDSSNSGVRVEDLFKWNSIILKTVEGELFVEYVHVRKDSFRFAVGDSVKTGDIICMSGAAGFCPEPHLHFEIHASGEPGSDSLELRWKGSPFFAGQSYP